jgi:hypothetical protein
MRFLAFLFLVAVAGIGYLRTFFRLSKLEDNRRFVDQYIKKFQNFSETYHDQFDSDLYHWLTHRVLRAQSLASDNVVWESFDPKLQEAAAQKSASLVETLDQMGQHSVPTDRVQSLTSFMIRYLGGLDDYIENMQQQQKNPLLLFRQGIQGILLAPAMALRWVTGTETTAEELAPQREIGRWTAFFSIVFLIVPLIVILAGWTPIVETGSYLFSALSEWFEELVDKLGEISLPESEEAIPVEAVEEPDLSVIEGADEQ